MLIARFTSAARCKWRVWLAAVDRREEEEEEGEGPEAGDVFAAEDIICNTVEGPD